MLLEAAEREAVLVGLEPMLVVNQVPMVVPPI
jgi:hypothetical protein